MCVFVKQGPRVQLRRPAGAAAPSEGRALHAVSNSGVTSPLHQTGAADLAPPVRRGSGPFGGQGATRSAQLGVTSPLHQTGPRIWLRQSAGTAAPSGGRALHAVRNRGGYFNQPRFLKYHIGTTALAIIKPNA